MPSLVDKAALGRLQRQRLPIIVDLLRLHKTDVAARAAHAFARAALPAREADDWRANARYDTIHIAQRWEAAMVNTGNAWRRMRWLSRRSPVSSIFLAVLAVSASKQLEGEYAGRAAGASATAAGLSLPHRLRVDGKAAAAVDERVLPARRHISRSVGAGALRCNQRYCWYTSRPA